jgi:lipopolysaccharide export system protein LptA
VAPQPDGLWLEWFCKFHAADMPPRLRPPLAALLLLGALPAWADRADRLQPLTIEADKPGLLDLAKQIVVFNGNVVVTQGTMVVRAERAEVRQTPEGARSATLTGTAGKPANFRQKREGLNEYIEGAADRIEYDARSDVLRFIGNASVRRLRDGTAADQISGQLITYDNRAETFNVDGGGNGGRVRAVLIPAPEPAASGASR